MLLINHGNLFVTFLEAVKSKFKMLTTSWFIPCWFYALSSPGRRDEGALGGLLYEDVNPILEGSTLLTWSPPPRIPPPNTTHFWTRFQHKELGGAWGMGTNIQSIAKSQHSLLSFLCNEFRPGDTAVKKLVNLLLLWWYLNSVLPQSICCCLLLNPQIAAACILSRFLATFSWR